MKNFRHALSPKLSRYFSILGALVLASTFIVHDQLGEQAKELISDVQSAQSQYDLRRRLKLLNDRVLSIDRNKQDNAEDEAFGEPLPTTQGEADKEVLEELSFVQSTKDSYADLQPLIEVVRNRIPVDQYEKQIKASDANLSKAEGDFHSSSLTVDAGNAVFKKADNESLSPRQSKDISVIDDQASAISKTVDTLTSEVLKAAGEELKRRKKARDCFTFASWILYPFGSLLVIAGKALESSEKPNDADVLP